MRRRTLHVIIAILGTSLVLSACGGSSTDEGGSEAPSTTETPATATTTASGGTASGEVTEITWLHELGEDFQQPVLLEVIDQFEAEHPNIKVNLSFVPFSDLGPKMNAAAAAGDSSFDLVEIAKFHIPGLVNLGYVEDLGPYVENDPEFVDLLSPGWEIEYNGTLRAIAFFVFPFQMAYNANMLESVGVDPPASWDEHKELAAALTDTSTGSYGFLSECGKGDYIMTRLFGSRLASLGGQFLDDDGNVAFDSPEGVAAFQWWKDMWDEGLMPSECLTMAPEAMMELMAADRLATYHDGPWIGGYVAGLNEDAEIRYAEPWCDVTCGQIIESSGLAISAFSEHKDEAWEFIKFLYSPGIDELVMNDIIVSPIPTKNAMASLETSSDPTMVGVPALFDIEPESNLTTPILPNMQDLVDALGVEFQEMLINDKPAEDAIRDLADIWQAEIDASR